ncbi:RNA polymerase II subunit 3 [Aspergillus luchuensis]|uniref:RNA polymerase II subunit 3 n=1 Tax=Aspergillus kawachii TaxID=1069201 RepID=A0A146FD16_ASPKA|nr:RNA polymerase II subunit 3 [Aspergillus luchuensis]
MFSARSACIWDKKLVQHLYIHHAVYAPSSAVSTAADAHDRARHTALFIEQTIRSIPGERGRITGYCCPMPGATSVATNQAEIYLKKDKPKAPGI